MAITLSKPEYKELRNYYLNHTEIKYGEWVFAFSMGTGLVLGILGEIFGYRGFINPISFGIMGGILLPFLFYRAYFFCKWFLLMKSPDFPKFVSEVRNKIEAGSGLAHDLQKKGTIRQGLLYRISFSVWLFSMITWFVLPGAVELLDKIMYLFLPFILYLVFVEMKDLIHRRFKKKPRTN